MKASFKSSFALLAVCAVLAVPSACVKKGCTDPEALNYQPKAERDDQSCKYGEKYEDEKREILEHHADVAYLLYADALAKAILLDTAIKSFINVPSSDGLNAAQLAWKTARHAFMRCEGLRFSNGPVDDQRRIDRTLSAWPIDIKFVDYTPTSKGGIVNDTSIISKINADSLLALNEAEGKGKISTGFHVVEYLLWSFDTSDVSEALPGLREYTDYDPAFLSAKNQKRRGLYLQACGDLLVRQLTSLKNDWDPLVIQNYRSSFVALDVNIGLQNIIQGVATLAQSELAERALLQPLQNVNPDLEMSRFSDNTTLELVFTVESISILYNGTFEPETAALEPGRSLHDLMVVKNPELEASVQQTLEDLATSVTEISSPFDWHITKEATKGEGAVAKTAELLMQFEDLMFEVASDNDFGLNTKLPN